MSRSFMNPDEPNFIWKNLNAAIDMNCIIESELPDILPNKRYETYSVEGRSGELTETFDDYEAFDLEIENITIPHNKLREIKRWLTGKSRLITHNDPGKYLEAICSMEKEVPFTNEWGFFYTFDVTFRCQPFKKRLNEQPIIFSSKQLTIENDGDETSSPYIEIDSMGGDITITVGEYSLTVKNTLADTIKIDNELGEAVQDDALLFTTGDWLKMPIGKNVISITGAFSEIRFWNRSLYL